MKSFLTGVLMLSAIGPLLAGQERVRVQHPAPAEVPGAAILPISVGGGVDAREPMRLRDALRQPFDDMDDTSKPYRLSVEERQRLREQLRDQTPYESRLKP